MAARARSWSPTASTAESGIDPDDLGVGLDEVWAMLVAAVGDPAAPLRTPVVATGDGDARVMVVRRADREASSLSFFTDSRAPKVRAVDAARDVVVVGYDPARRRQLRLHGTATIATAGAAVDAAWAGVPPPARRSYRTVAAPGSALSSPSADLRDDDGRATFAVLIVTVAAIDVLDLAAPGHRRAAYRRAGPAWTGEWRVP